MTDGCMTIVRNDHEFGHAMLCYAMACHVGREQGHRIGPGVL